MVGLLKKENLTRKPKLMMKSYHIVLLLFTYSFGFFIPTIMLLTSDSKNPTPSFFSSFIIKSLAVDLLSTVLLSFFLLDRRMFGHKNGLDLICPVILCFLAVYCSD